MKIRRFTYDGFGTTFLPGYAPYTGTFVNWHLPDPGIAKVECSDGKTRMVPSCAFHLDKGEVIPPPPQAEWERMAEVHGVVLGWPSTSE